MTYTGNMVMRQSLSLALLTLLAFANEGYGELPDPMERELWDGNQTADFIDDIELSIASLHHLENLLREWQDKPCWLFIPPSAQPGDHHPFSEPPEWPLGEFVTKRPYRALFLDISDRHSFYPKIRYIIIYDEKIVQGEQQLTSDRDKGIRLDGCKDVFSLRKTIGLSDNPALKSLQESISAEHVGWVQVEEELPVSREVTDKLLRQVQRIESLEHIPASYETVIDFVETAHQALPWRIGDNIVYIGRESKVSSIFVSPYLSNGAATGNLGDALIHWFKTCQEMKSDNGEDSIAELFGDMIVNTYFFRNAPQQ